jgi:hypothetical protein
MPRAEAGPVVSQMTNGGAACLGHWKFPSGRTVALLLGPPSDVRELTQVWSDPSPLVLSEQVYYLDVVRPEALRRLAEYLELPGRHVVIER